MATVTTQRRQVEQQLPHHLDNSRKADIPQQPTPAVRSSKRGWTSGETIFLTFCLSYGAAMVAAFQGKIPELEWERMPLEDVLSVVQFLGDNMWLPTVLAVVYVVVIFGIQSHLADRQPFDLRKPLAIWSVILSVFSIWGSLRTVPAVFQLLSERGLNHTLCGDSRFDWLVNQPAGTWTVLFIFSKLPELIDTLFIVLRKKRLITLHWYHHITVMLFCWHSLATMNLNGIVFSSMNLTVHAFMYFFYAITALGFRPTRFAIYITGIQILQMFVGTAVAVYVSYHSYWRQEPETSSPWLEAAWNTSIPDELPGDECKAHPINAVSGLAMYASYLWLFSAFFVSAYVRPTKASKTKRA